MTTAALRVRCPAKVNLALHVLGKRGDGYHELDTIFQAIDLWDEIEVQPGPGPMLHFSCDHPALAIGPMNLVLRAAEALRARTGTTQGASFTLHKRIPIGGGLGGGSSDAAGTLLALRAMWSLPIGDDALRDVAAGLGSDCAFFLTGGTARGTGRGERIERLPCPGPLPILLGAPPFGIETKEVYRRFAERLTPPEKGGRVRRFSTLKLPGPNDFSLGANDLEAVVLEGWPELAASRTLLRERGATLSMVSGSGSTVFGVFEHDAARDRALDSARSAFPQWTWIPTKAVDGGATVVSDASGRTDPSS